MVLLGGSTRSANKDNIMPLSKWMNYEGDFELAEGDEKKGKLLYNEYKKDIDKVNLYKILEGLEKPVDRDVLLQTTIQNIDVLKDIIKCRSDYKCNKDNDLKSLYETFDKLVTEKLEADRLNALLPDAPTTAVKPSRPMKIDPVLAEALKQPRRRSPSRGRSKQFRTADDTVKRGLAYAYRDRRQKKRSFRSLWIARINAAARLNGLSYSCLMNGLKLAGVEVNRKVLANLAVTDADAFSSLTKRANQYL